MAAHQAPPSLGFSRQEHWSGLPFPSPMHESEKWKWSCSVMSDSSRPHGLQPTRLLRPWDFPGKSTGTHVVIYIFLLALTGLVWTQSYSHPWRMWMIDSTREFWGPLAYYQWGLVTREFRIKHLVPPTMRDEASGPGAPHTAWWHHLHHVPVVVCREEDGGGGAGEHIFTHKYLCQISSVKKVAKPVLKTQCDRAALANIYERGKCWEREREIALAGWERREERSQGCSTVWEGCLVLRKGVEKARLIK